MNVCVFCSANELDAKYARPAEELAGLLTAYGHGLVWGGSTDGLMGIVANSVRRAGGTLIGVSTQDFMTNALQDADELIVAKDMGERKALLLHHADAIIVLVGGLGTLDELGDVIELKHQGHHLKPIIVVNTEGFYDGLHTHLRTLVREGFLPTTAQPGIQVAALDELVHFVDTPQEAIDFLETATAAGTVSPTINRAIVAELSNRA